MANNPLDVYNSFSNSTQIKFLHGSQSGINQMITQGGAIEGAFYLADDTQKLYVGRKDNSDQKVYPVQVSRGVTIVANTADLPINLNAITTRTDAASWAIEEGELYYITDSNILAALRINPNNPNSYEWVQVNPPTGLTGMTYDYSSQSYSGVDVFESELQITTQASTQAQSAVQRFVGGNNVTIANTTVVDDNVSPNVSYQAIEISSNDTQYAIGANVITNGAVVGLSKNNEVNLDSNVDLISKSNSIDITYNSSNNAIEFNGPTLSSVNIDAISNGFTVAVTMNNGKGAQTIEEGEIFPNISYGQAGTKSISVFENGTADLNVYTIEQADNAISAAINGRLQTADALSYKGTVYYDDLGPNIVSYFTSKPVSTGDVYKVSLNSTEVVTINGNKVKNGDLIIFNGGNTYPNVISSSALINANTIQSYMDIVPSGDEMDLDISLGQGIGGNDAILTFSDVVRGSTASTLISSVELHGGNLISIIGAVDATGKNNTITINHGSPGTRTDTTNYLMNNVNESATFGTETYKFFALAPNIAEAIQTDALGHVIGVKGKEIVFKHNRLTSLTTSYIDQNTYASNVSFSIGATDDLGGLSGVEADIDIVSNTLKFTSDSDSSHLAIDLVWESFES